MRSNNTLFPDHGNTMTQLFARRRRTINDIEKELVRHDLERAVMLGNIYDESACIHYEDQWGAPHKVEAQVQAATEFFAILRGGVTIPIKQITRVIT